MAYENLELTCLVFSEFPFTARVATHYDGFFSWALVTTLSDTVRSLPITNLCRVVVAACIASITVELGVATEFAVVQAPPSHLTLTYSLKTRSLQRLRSIDAATSSNEHGDI